MEDFDRQVKALLDEAMKQPGVVDIMESYAAQKVAMDTLERAQQALAPRWVVSSSASSSNVEI